MQRLIQNLNENPGCTTGKSTILLSFNSGFELNPILFIDFHSDSAKAQVSDEAKDKTISEWLWKVSEKWSGLETQTEKKK